jgi:adenine-specific DNA-methyltransferase
MDILKKYLKKADTILEPSCGSGEYFPQLREMFPTAIITGIEKNNTIYDDVKEFENENIKIHNTDYLTYESPHKYNLIIGNPPYFVMKKTQVDEEYHEYFDGRPNIFILFIIKSLGLLEKDGILSFVLPYNFLNSLYYDNTRSYIKDEFKILDIIECMEDEFIDTKQKTVILLIQNKSGAKNDKFVLDMNGNTILGTKDNIKKMRTLYKNSDTLNNLGFNVNVGPITWNQVKDELTRDDTKTQLIYSSDIQNNEFKPKMYSNPMKKNYIEREGRTSPVLVINRGYGKGKYKFDYCIIDGKKEYLIENHLMCIRSKVTVENDILIDKYNKIVESLKNKKTLEFIDLYFRNNAINTTELNYMVPIYGFK